MNLRLKIEYVHSELSKYKEFETIIKSSPILKTQFYDDKEVSEKIREKTTLSEKKLAVSNTLIECFLDNDEAFELSKELVPTLADATKSQYNSHIDRLVKNINKSLDNIEFKDIPPTQLRFNKSNIALMNSYIKRFFEPTTKIVNEPINLIDFYNSEKDNYEPDGIYYLFSIVHLLYQITNNYYYRNLEKIKKYLQEHSELHYDRLIELITTFIDLYKTGLYNLDDNLRKLDVNQNLETNTSHKFLNKLYNAHFIRLVLDEQSGKYIIELRYYYYMCYRLFEDIRYELQLAIFMKELSF